MIKLIYDGPERGIGSIKQIIMEELKKLIQEALEETKADRKKLWSEDREEKAECDGAIGAYQYCLSMIKKLEANVNQG